MSGHGKGAWSTLPTLLAEKNLTVADLHQILQKGGFAVNKKSLYRLAASAPVQKLDVRIVRAVCEALGVRLEDLIQFQKPKFELKHLDAKSQKELDRLMDKNNEGELTKSERARFKALLDEVHKITLYNSKALLSQKRLRESTLKPDAARVPHPRRHSPESSGHVAR
jgi:DNA-binding Xre family transcriptional regulator